MNNANLISSGSESGRNVNAEWAILKEKAEAGVLLSWEADFNREASEREKYRNIGSKLLRVIGRMPDRLPDDEKRAKLDRLHRLAEGVGIGDDFEDALGTGLQSFEKVGRATFGEDTVELTAEEETRVELLREKVVDLTEVEPGALAERFPSGNYLFHGSTIGKIEKIFATGGLKNGVALAEDDPEVSGLNMNSGFEGISWSMNEIDALPGTRGHIAGFLAAPEDVLDGSEKLVVPSRPAPYEVLQISETVKPQELYYLKNQCETWGDGGVSLGEKNSVDSNLMWMLMYKEGDKFFGSSTVYNYNGDKSADRMREYFSFDNGKVVWDEDVYQKMEIPPALPWFQTLIDSGRLARNGFAELDTVDKILDRAKEEPEFVKKLLATERMDSKPLQEKYAEMLDDAAAIRIRPEEMYFVTSHKDLEDWLKVMARTGVEPKGIMLYDDEQVVMENFASKYEGNHGALSAEIGRAIGVNHDFWRDEIGMDPQEMSRSGSVGQVLLESEVRRNKSIKVVDRRLEVVVEE